jgi:hypothetical protein
MEEGWEILSDMVSAADSIGPLALEGVYLRDAADERRYVFSVAVESIPGPWGFDVGPSMGTSPGEMEGIARLLSVLDMATADARFPPELREPVQAGAKRFDAWLIRYTALVEPIARIEDRYLSGAGPPPKTLTAPLRLVD